MSARRRTLDVLLAWLDAGRRGDRDAMLALLAPDAAWQGIRPEWRCSTPAEVVDEWLRRSAQLDDLDAVELGATATGAVLSLRAPSLAAVDLRLQAGVHIGFEIDADGRIARMVDGADRATVLPTDPDDTPHGIPEAPVRDGRAAGPGWYVVNAADAPWLAGAFGAFTTFQGDVRFPQLGVNIGILEPGQPACYYHREGDQEDFLVLRGEALLLVEGEERRLRQWDFFHCPAWTEHVIVGAGDRPCAILAVGGRADRRVVYPAAELALRHGAGVRTQTTLPSEAYEGIPEDRPVPFDPGWL